MAKNTPDVCSDHYNCCDCGGNECGCAYCFSCHACEYCRSGEGEHCELISDEVFSRLTSEQKRLAEPNNEETGARAYTGQLALHCLNCLKVSAKPTTHQGKYMATLRDLQTTEGLKAAGQRAAQCYQEGQLAAICEKHPESDNSGLGQACAAFRAQPTTQETPGMTTLVNITPSHFALPDGREVLSVDKDGFPSISPLMVSADEKAMGAIALAIYENCVPFHTDQRNIDIAAKWVRQFKYAD